jgi:hypothetical protein
MRDRRTKRERRQDRKKMTNKKEEMKTKDKANDENKSALAGLGSVLVVRLLHLERDRDLRMKGE